MSLKAKLTEDMKLAMKAQDKGRLAVIRMLLSEMKYAQAQVNIHAELSDEEAQKAIAAYGKKLQKSLAEYPDDSSQAEQIKSEIAVVDSYLPKRASADEVKRAIAKVLQSTNDKQFGVLMKAVMAELGGNADGKLVSQLLKENVG